MKKIAIPESGGEVRHNVVNEANILAVASLIASFSSGNTLTGQALFAEAKKLAEQIVAYLEESRRSLS